MRQLPALFGLILLCSSALAQTDPYAGNARGTLHLRVELAGRDRVDLPNGVEWFAIEAWRTLELDYRLVDVGNDGVPIVGGVREGMVPPAARDLEARLAACGEDQKCLADAMMDFARSGEGGGNPFEAMLGMQPGRYRNFAGDRSGTCANGTLVVQDVLSGVVIPPPLPARPYRFTRDGSVTLPTDSAAVMDKACGIEVTLDTATGAMSLRLPLGQLPVPVTLGPGGFTDETSVLLVEANGPIELIDRPAGGATWSGVAELKGIGTASHNSGQTSAPLSGRVEWRFLEE